MSPTDFIMWATLFTCLGVAICTVFVGWPRRGAQSDLGRIIRRPNTKRAFGSATEHAWIICREQDGSIVPIAMTEIVLRDAKRRADANPEDCPAWKPEDK